jgi:hypothetical protein
MAVAANADDYAAARLNIFFPGVTPDLDGQCVSLEKWFLGEMAGVSDWNAARGNANTCGRTLVAQGLAVEVPYANRQRGDVVCLEYGTYGHVYIQLSGGRVFEENVNWPGVASKVVDGATVYASRIGSDQEAWRIAAGKNPHVYRLKGYSEGGSMATNPNNGDVVNILGQLWGRAPNPEDYGYASQNWHDAIYGMLAAYPWVNRKHILDVDYPQACTDRDNNLGVAETRSANLQAVCDGVGVQRLPDEQVTSQNIIAKFKTETQAAADAVAGQTKLQGQVTDLQAQIKALQSGDNIIITRTGFNGLFDVIKQYFAKK